MEDDLKKKIPAREGSESENKQMKRREVSEVRKDESVCDAAGCEMWQGTREEGFCLWR